MGRTRVRERSTKIWAGVERLREDCTVQGHIMRVFREVGVPWAWRSSMHSRNPGRSGFCRVVPGCETIGCGKCIRVTLPTIHRVAHRGYKELQGPGVFGVLAFLERFGILWTASG